MAIHGYPGNIISASSPLYTPGFASGIWNLGNWPAGVTVVQTFTASGYWTAPAGVTAVDYLVVAGGGGGGFSAPATNPSKGRGGSGYATYTAPGAIAGP